LKTLQIDLGRVSNEINNFLAKCDLLEVLTINIASTAAQDKIELHNHQNLKYLNFIFANEFSFRNMKNLKHLTLEKCTLEVNSLENLYNLEYFKF
jgi:hypothetical protein